MFTPYYVRWKPDRYFEGNFSTFLHHTDEAQKGRNMSMVKMLQSENFLQTFNKYQ